MILRGGPREAAQHPIADLQRQGFLTNRGTWWMQPLLPVPPFEDSEAKYDTWILDLFQFATVTTEVQDIARVLKDRLEAECANPAVLKKGVETCLVFCRRAEATHGELANPAHGTRDVTERAKDF